MFGFELGRTTTLLQKMSLASRYDRQASAEATGGGEADVLDNGFFDWLPDETIQHILKFLDVRSMCRAAMSCSLLFQLCYDPMLPRWRNVDLQPYWTQVDTVALKGLEVRCQNLLRLSLSWTGGGQQITEQAFCQFINVCGSQLICLRVACCQFIGNAALKTIADVCKNIEELDLQSCTLDTNNRRSANNALAHLTKVRTLKRLNLYNTPVRDKELAAIICNNPGLQHLNLGSCKGIQDDHTILLKLAQHCKGLLSLDMWRHRGFSSAGLMEIAENCFHLQEIDVGWSSQNFHDVLPVLARNCPDLRKLFLTATRNVTNEAILAMAQHCPNLEQFDVLGSGRISADAIRQLLNRCTKLFFLDVSFCMGLDDQVVQQLRKDFPKVAIKKSFS